jgi:hypothetical protein
MTVAGMTAAIAMTTGVMIISLMVSGISGETETGAGHRKLIQ